MKKIVIVYITVVHCSIISGYYSVLNLFMVNIKVYCSIYSLQILLENTIMYCTIKYSCAIEY